MSGEIIPGETIAALDQALTDVLGLHSGWVLAIETYDDNGEPHLGVMWDPTSTKWTQIGMARALLLDVEAPFRDQEADDD